MDKYTVRMDGSKAVNKEVYFEAADVVAAMKKAEDLINQHERTFDDHVFRFEVEDARGFHID